MDKKLEIKFLEEFKIEDCDLIFRYKKIAPTKLLAITKQMGEYKFEVTVDTFNFILDNVECKIEGLWKNIKSGDFYFPTYLEERLDVLQRLITKFVNEVVTPLFTNSKGLV